MPEHQTSSSEKYYISPKLYQEMNYILQGLEQDVFKSGEKDGYQIHCLIGKVEGARMMLHHILREVDNREELQALTRR